jgi:hypothetical protein
MINLALIERTGDLESHQGEINIRISVDVATMKPESNDPDICTTTAATTVT